MDVEAAQARRVQHRQRQDEAISRDHGGIGVQRIERRCSASSLKESGVRTGRPRFSAKACTGLGRGALPRPAGRGGWV